MARACRDDLPDGQSEEFFRMGLDSQNQVERVQQIRFLAQAREREFRHAKCIHSPFDRAEQRPSGGGRARDGGIYPRNRNARDGACQNSPFLIVLLNQAIPDCLSH